MPGQVCYNTYPEKRRLFAKQTAPAIIRAARQSAQHERDYIAAWLDSHGVLKPDTPWDQLARLHNAARRGKYVPHDPDHCDSVQTAQRTIEHGGDCDQWAHVLLACCLLLGIRAVLVSFGDGQDPYQHAAVVAEIGQAAIVLDPKGSQRGADFNEWPDMDLTAGWRL